MPRVIFCVVQTDVEARAILATLRKSGFADDQLSVLSPDKSPKALNRVLKENAGFTGASLDSDSADLPNPKLDDVVSPNGHPDDVANVPEVAAGMLAGGVAAGALGIMAALLLFAIPGVGPFMASGPLFLVLSTVAAGATVVGIGAILIDLGVPPLEAKRYDELIREGRTLIAVHADSEGMIKRAQAVFEAGHAEHIHITTDRTTKVEPYPSVSM